MATYDPDRCRALIAAVLQLAVREFIYGDPVLHKDAAIFLSSNRARELFGALGIDAGAASSALNSNRRRFVGFLVRSEMGDESVESEYKEWFREHFDFRSPEL